MRPESHLRERLRAANEDLASLFALVLGTGFLLGLTSNIASSYLIERSTRWLWLAISAALTVLLPGLFIWLVFSRGYSADSIIEVVLPFRVSDRESEILNAQPYPVTRLLHQRLHAILDEGENREAFLHDWKEAVKAGSRPFQKLARRCVKDLLVYAVLDALRGYCEQTLTTKWVFTGHRWKTNRLSAKDLPESDWPVDLRSNLCFAGQKKGHFQVLKLPECFSLDVRERQSAAGHEQIEIILESTYGNLMFVIAPHAQRIRSQSREGSILFKYCDSAPNDKNVWAAKFYVQVRAEFGGLGIFTRRFREDVFPWVERAIEWVRDDLDWQLCLDGDLERMVVALTTDVQALRQALHAPALADARNTQLQSVGDA